MSKPIIQRMSENKLTYIMARKKLWIFLSVAKIMRQVNGSGRKVVAVVNFECWKRRHGFFYLQDVFTESNIIKRFSTIKRYNKFILFRIYQIQISNL